jgi:hypothetical protein
MNFFVGEKKKTLIHVVLLWFAPSSGLVAASTKHLVPRRMASKVQLLGTTWR